MRRLRDRTHPWGTVMTIKFGMLAAESSDFPHLARATIRPTILLPISRCLMIHRITIRRFPKSNFPNSMDLTLVYGGIIASATSRCTLSIQR